MIFLGINNHGRSHQRIELESKQNLSRFESTQSTLLELGESNNMLTNIDDMNNKLKKLIEEGQISTDDIEHTLLSGFLNGALEIQLKARKSSEDINDFYTTYRNFGDVHKTLRGEKS